MDPLASARWANPIYVSLLLYTLYGGVVYYLWLRRNPFVMSQIVPWLDLLFYIPLIVFSSGTNSIFYYFFFFSIIVAAFRWGMNAGLRLTLASAALFTIVGIVTASRTDGPIEINRILLPPIGLLIFGYLISRWGGYYTNLNNRLLLLKEITLLSNPRFGIDRTIRTILESVRAFYDAEVCLLLTPGRNDDGSDYQMHRVARGNLSSKTLLSDIGKDAAGIFLTPDPSHAVLYQRDQKPQAKLFDAETKLLIESKSDSFEKLAIVLDADQYLSVPINYLNRNVGRLCIVDGRANFDSSDVEFALQLTDHLTPAIENIRLTENLASDAAEQERQRIAHDIHDSVIQPYLGLRFGLAAINQNLEAGNTAVSGSVNELLELTNNEITELRRYVRGLRSGEKRTDVLVPAIQRYAARFFSVTGIRVEVTYSNFDVSDRIAGELFQIVTEGLSNIRRHALSDDARIRISCDSDVLILDIKNSRPHTNGFNGRNNHDRQVSFSPRSITERAALLGGDTRVFVDEQDYTVVRVSIPV